MADKVRVSKGMVVLGGQCHARALEPDEALELAHEIVKAAAKVDPLAEAKFRGIGMAEELRRQMWRMRDWGKVPGYKAALAAYRKKEGREVDDIEVFHFFGTPNIDVGPWEPIPYELVKAQGKCRSPIQALREGDREACMHAILVHGEMGS